MHLTLGMCVEQLSKYFEQAALHFGHGTDNAWDEACFLVLTVCQLPPDSPHTVAKRPLSDTEYARIQDLAMQRVTKRIPMPYLLNKAWFAQLPFYVDTRVLIPRSPFAHIIQNQLLPWCDPTHVKSALDLCTGSGCMAIALAHHLPHIQVDATDLSHTALAVARINVTQHHLTERVTLIQSDLFSALHNKQYDLIITNPPYVDQQDMSTLPPEYLHEPRMALEAGQSGLDIVHRILQEAKSHLTPQGALLLEAGNSCIALEAAYPTLPFTWIDNPSGDDGICLLDRVELP